MPTPTYDLLADATLTSSASSIQLTGITGTYSKFLLLGYATFTSTGSEVRLNGLSATNQQYLFAQNAYSNPGNGSRTTNTDRTYNPFTGYFFMHGIFQSQQGSVHIWNMEASSIYTNYEVDTWYGGLSGSTLTIEVVGTTTFDAGSNFQVYGV